MITRVFVMLCVMAIAATLETEADLSILLVIPGHGLNRRWNMLESSVTHLRNSCIGHPIKFHCVIYSYNINYSLALMSRNLCEVVESEGLWTHHMLKVKHRGYSHIALLMDDVNASNVSIPHSLSAMLRSKMNVVSAAMEGWHYKHMHSFPPPCIVHEVNFIDMLFAIFTRKAWVCWVSIMDPLVNPSGWGYDLVFKRKCKVRLGVLDNQSARHGEGGLPKEEKFGYKTRTYNATVASSQMIAYMANIFQLPSNESVRSRVVSKLMRHKYPRMKNESCVLSNN
jgi:hypothetical protein